MINQSIPGFTKQDFRNRFWDIFHDQVTNYKERFAVITRNSSLSYQDLNRKANQITCAIQEISQEKQIGIGLLLTGACKIAPTFVGVLKSNNYIVMLDPVFPVSRLMHMIDEAGIRLIITDNEHHQTAMVLETGENHIINIDTLVMDIDLPDPNLTITESDTVQILFTSGSTGVPKGVIEHYGYLFRNVYNNIIRYQVTNQDRYLSSHSFNFAGAHNSLFTCLFSGGTFAHYPVEKEGLVGFKQFLQEKKITLYFSTPTIFRTFLQILQSDDRFPDIRSVQLGGEKRLIQDFQAYKTHFPGDCIFTVTFATAETHILTFNKFTQQSEFNVSVLPSGFPEAGIDLFIWDENGLQLPPGEEGEIVASGDAFARGYINRPSLTSEKFLPDPRDPDKQIYRTGDVGKILPDGQLQHIRRIDDQVKIKGIRVELGSVESHLISYPGIVQVAVKTVDDNETVSKLAAYYVTKDNDSISIHDLRVFLSERLPAAMIPLYFIQLEKMPMTGTSKIDKKSLPRPQMVRPELPTPYKEPSSAMEKDLVLIWEKILGTEKIGVLDNFLELGGESLTAIQIISRVNQIFGIEFPMRAMMESPSIAKMAEEINQAMIENLTSEETGNILADIEDLTEEQVQFLLEQEKKSGSDS